MAKGQLNQSKQSETDRLIWEVQLNNNRKFFKMCVIPIIFRDLKIMLKLGIDAGNNKILGGSHVEVLTKHFYEKEESKAN